MAEMAFGEFALALAPSLGVPGKPSHELTVVAERVYDALVGAGVNVREVVEGQPVLTQDEAALVVGAMPLQAFPVEPRPDLSRLRELVKELDAIALIADPPPGTGSKPYVPDYIEAFKVRLTEALDAIEKGSS